MQKNLGKFVKSLPDIHNLIIRRVFCKNLWRLLLFKYLSNEFEQISDDSNAGIPECLGKTSTGSKNANDNLVRNGARLQLPDLLPASTAV